MHFKSLVRVVGVGALGHFKVQVPVNMAFGASHYRASVDHFLILAARGSSTGSSIRSLGEDVGLRISTGCDGGQLVPVGLAGVEQ